MSCASNIFLPNRLLKVLLMCTISRFYTSLYELPYIEILIAFSEILHFGSHVRHFTMPLLCDLQLRFSKKTMHIVPVAESKGCEWSHLKQAACFS